MICTSQKADKLQRATDWLEAMRERYSTASAHQTGERGQILDNPSCYLYHHKDTEDAENGYTPELLL
jgi:hypothetical protein